MGTAPREGGRMVEQAIIMASIDRRPDGDYLVIADIACDGRWLSVPLADGIELVEHL